jgi:hypothetical protein
MHIVMLLPDCELPSRVREGSVDSEPVDFSKLCHGSTQSINEELPAVLVKCNRLFLASRGIADEQHTQYITTQRQMAGLCA